MRSPSLTTITSIVSKRGLARMSRDAVRDAASSGTGRAACDQIWLKRWQPSPTVGV